MDGRHLEKISMLEDEVESLRRERDKFRGLLAASEAKSTKRKMDLLDLESKYESEKRKRFRVEEKLQNALASTETVPEPQIFEQHCPVKLEQHDHGDQSSLSKYLASPEGRGSRIQPSLQGKFDQRPTSTRALITEQESKLSSPSSLPSPLADSNHAMKGPKAEIKDCFKITKGRVSHYLAKATALVISPRPLSIRVSRAALTHKFGLPGMGLLWESKNGDYKFLTPKYDVNPEMPRTPGAPGLLLSCRNEMCDGGTWTLFMTAEGEKNVRLNYAGEYSCKAVGVMTAEEFANQNFTVKDCWGKKIMSHKKFLPYRQLRARMTLRKQFNRTPTANEIAAEAKAIKAKNYQSDLKCEDVIAAFERGEEHINIVKIECVSYSHEQARRFAAAQVSFEAYLKVTKETKQRNTKSNAGTSKQSRAQTAPRNSKNVKLIAESSDADLDTSDDELTSRPSSYNMTPSPAMSMASTRLRSQRRKMKSFKLRQQEELD